MINFSAFVHELGELGAVSDEQLKVAADLSRDDAEHALHRLEGLETARPTGGQLLRGAAVGAIASPIASNISRLISHGEFTHPRDIAGQVAGGLVMGTALPFAKHKLETGAERKTLRNYIEQSPRGRLAKDIETKLETP